MLRGTIWYAQENLLKSDTKEERVITLMRGVLRKSKKIVVMRIPLRIKLSDQSFLFEIVVALL